MSLPPVVYVGPSLAACEVKRWLPNAQLMPPASRGDLYRDRLLGFGVFLLIDGVFLQELATSPREIVDVLRDGATVIGASSMGAIRAAECWPAGMRGVGAIYRMFRRGILTSDEDVAVKCYPMPPYTAITVPSVNVRYAVSRAMGDGLLTRTMAARIVQAAAQCHFADRTWPAVLRIAGLSGQQHDALIETLSRYDLKNLDARRAVKRVAEGPRDVAPPRPTPWPPLFVTQYRRREASHHRSADALSRVSAEELWQWLLGTGRYRRYALQPLGAVTEPRIAFNAGDAERPDAATDDCAEASERINGGESILSEVGVVRADLIDALARGRTSVCLLEQLSRHDGAAAKAVWADIAVTGDLDGLVLRFTAMNDAAAWADTAGLKPDANHEYLARYEIASRHGFRRWSDMQAALGAASRPWAWIERACRLTALAKRVRHELFSGRVPVTMDTASAARRARDAP